MGTEDNTDAPQSADHDTAEDRAEAVQRVIQELDHITNVDAHRAHNSQHNRKHDDQADAGDKNQLQHLRNDLFQPLFQEVQADDCQNNGDDRLGVGKNLGFFAHRKGHLNDRQAEDGGLGGHILDHSIDGGMAQEGTQHHGDDLVGLQSLGSGVGQEDGHEVKDDVAGGVQDHIGAGGTVHPAQLGNGGQQALDKTGRGNGRHQGGEDLAQLLDEQVAEALLLSGDLHVALANHLAAQQRHSLVVNLVDLAAQNHLELAGSLYHLDHALQTADHILVRLFAVPQHETETGEAVGHRLDVLFAADILNDVGSDLFVVHTDPPQIFPNRRKKRPER